MPEIWGELPDGSPVHRHGITGGGLTAHVLSHGALIQDLRLKGHKPALVLGFEEFAPYLTQSPYFGAIAGRYANRIRGGRFTLGEITYQLDQNFLGKHTLHGGSKSMGKRLWQIEAAEPDAITLRIDLADGEMGFPGNMVARCRYSVLKAGVLDVTLTAETDAPTICNLAHHSYFTLDGGETILDHTLQVDAESYISVDEELIPLGELFPVEGTAFDFFNPRKLEGMGVDGKIDHNLCLSDTRTSIRKVATLRSPASGISMEIATTEPGLQVYTGSKINIAGPGLDGRSMGAFAGVALEPQVWPDAPNNASYPSAVLRPGETYAQHTQFIFKSKVGND